MSESLRKENYYGDNATSVTITLEDDTEIECVVLGIFDAGEREYIAVLPENPRDGEEEGLVYLYRYSETVNGEPELTNIESDEEYEIVSDAFDEMLDEQDFFDMELDDEE
jgi:hypothetical protein